MLIQRREEPLCGHAWPPGGRVHKNETLQAAARRKLVEELAPWGHFAPESLIMIGIYQEVYPAHSAGAAATGYHTVAAVFTVEMLDISGITLDHTSHSWALHDAPPARFRVEPWGQPAPGWSSSHRRNL